MPKTITKVANVATKPKKSYQIRVNITPELYQEIQKAKKAEFRFLDDAEIIKIFLSRGVNDKGNKVEHELDYSEISNEELMQIASNVFAIGEDWENEPDIIDYSKAKPINWNN
jgi:predicted GTPase